MSRVSNGIQFSSERSVKRCFRKVERLIHHPPDNKQRDISNFRHIYIYVNSRRRDAIFARRAKYMGEKARGGWKGGEKKRKKGVASRRVGIVQKLRVRRFLQIRRATRETYMPSPATKIKTRPATFSAARACIMQFSANSRRTSCHALYVRAARDAFLCGS